MFLSCMYVWLKQVPSLCLKNTTQIKLPRPVSHARATILFPSLFPLWVSVHNKFAMYYFHHFHKKKKKGRKSITCFCCWRHILEQWNLLVLAARRYLKNSAQSCWCLSKLPLVATWVPGLLLILNTSALCETRSENTVTGLTNTLH